MVSVFTLLGPLLGGTAVADTLGEFIQLDDLPELDGVAVILSATLGAIGWNLVTWRRGLPSSSSHALVSGLVGAVLVETDSQHVVWGWNTLWETGEWSGVTKIVAALLLSPLVGLLFGFLLLRLLRLLLRAARPTVNRSLRRWEWLGAAGLAFSHGTNDAQKSMGDHHPGTAAGRTDRPVPGSRLGHPCLRTEHYPRAPPWAGWRIVRTVGFGIYRLRPVHGLASQMTAAAVISGTAMFGGPVSTTHVVSSSIMGVGCRRSGPRRSRWGKAGEILFTWLVTLPSAALAAAAVQWIMRYSQ